MRVWGKRHQWQLGQGWQDELSAPSPTHNSNSHISTGFWWGTTDVQCFFHQKALPEITGEVTDEGDLEEFQAISVVWQTEIRHCIITAEWRIVLNPQNDCNDWALGQQYTPSYAIQAGDTVGSTNVSLTECDLVLTCQLDFQERHYLNLTL